MRRCDVDAMADWRPLADPLYQPFDFPRRSKVEHGRWFNWRSKEPDRRLYSVLDEKMQVIGSLTLREIDSKRSSRLGITVGADYVSQGYGTEALGLFLDHYFGKMGFARLVLDVAATNLRAVRCYQRLGFRHSDKHYRPASHPSYRILRQEPRYQHLRQYFVRKGTFYQVLFYDLAMTREQWWAFSPSYSNQSAHVPSPR